MVVSHRSCNHGVDCVVVYTVGHNARQDKCYKKGENKDRYDDGGETSSARRRRPNVDLAARTGAQVLQRERLTRTEPTKAGCGVVEQSKKLGSNESGRGRSSLRWFDEPT